MYIVVEAEEVRGLLELAMEEAFSLARHNHYDKLKQLLDSGEHDPNEPDEKGNTILLVAIGASDFQKL